ncbi:hypothetical protein SEA_JOURNEY13_36 [Mycobacterium phage Journey13]|nr:hypothetical protein SEA_JOURNEY13_36 [Mycobacterium phage Journey13]
MKTIAALLISVAFILSLTACDGETATSDYDGPTGVVFMPMPGTPGPGMPIFF